MANRDWTLWRTGLWMTGLSMVAALGLGACDEGDDDEAAGSHAGSAGTLSEAGAAGAAGDSVGSSGSSGAAGTAAAGAPDAGGGQGGNDSLDELPFPKGNWVSQGYGYAVAADAQEFTLYEVTALSCIRVLNLPQSDVAEVIGEVTRLDEDRLAVPMGVSPLVIDRVVSLPEVCSGEGTPVQGQAGYERDPQFVFDVFAQTFSEHYAFFELRDVDWPAVVEEQRSEISSQTTDDELFQALSSLIQELNDGHVSLVAGDRDPIQSATTELEQTLAAEAESLGIPDEEYEAYLMDQIERIQEIIATYLDESDGDDDVAMRWGMLREDVAYLSIMGQPPVELIPDMKATLDELVAAIGDVPNLVVDVRTDWGGFDVAGVATAGYFADERTPAFTKAARQGDGETEPYTVYVDPASVVYPGRVVLLVGPDTVSAGETFSLMMRELPRVTLLGRPTMGVFSDIFGRTLPNGWQVGLSNEIYRTMDGEILEGLGVPPDVELPDDRFTLDNREAGIDHGLEGALAWIDEHPADEVEP